MATNSRPVSETILQWNINGLNNHRNDLRHLVSTYNPFLITLNESRTNDPSKIVTESFKNYTAYFDNSDSCKGNLIMIRKDVNFYPIALSNTINAIAVEIKRGGRRIKICSLYLSPNIALDMNALSNLFLELSPNSNTTDLLLLGDFNARNEYWYDILNNSRGNKILDLILHFNLEILNDDSPTHFSFSHRGHYCKDQDA